MKDKYRSICSISERGYNVSSKMRYSVILGRNLLYLARRSGKSIKAYAEELSGKKHYDERFYRWANCINSTNLNDAMEIAEKLGVSLDALCTIDLESERKKRCK